MPYFVLLPSVLYSSAIVVCCVARTKASEGEPVEERGEKRGQPSWMPDVAGNDTKQRNVSPIMGSMYSHHESSLRCKIVVRHFISDVPVCRSSSVVTVPRRPTNTTTRCRTMFSIFAAAHRRAEAGRPPGGAAVNAHRRVWCLSSYLTLVESVEDMIRDGCFLITDGTVGVAGRCQSRISQHSFGPKRIVCRVRTTQIPFFQNRFFGKFFFRRVTALLWRYKGPRSWIELRMWAGLKSTSVDWRWDFISKKPGLVTLDCGWHINLFELWIWPCESFILYLKCLLVFLSQYCFLGEA